MSNVNECVDAIYSESVADYIVDYAGSLEAIKQRTQAICIETIQERGRFVVAHSPLPSDGILPTRYISTGYRTIPKLYGLMDTSNLEEMGIYKLRRLPYLDLYGTGTLIGIVDTGINYTNPLFINADNTTRITGIWDQTIRSGNAPESFLYGTEYTQEQIDEALASDDPLSIVPSTDENGHGTFLAAVAAGNIDEKNDFSGIAPECNILVVKLKPSKKYLQSFFGIPGDVLSYQENDIMLGIEYLRRKALELRKPLSICFSLGTSSGDHMGASPLSSYMNSISNQDRLCICNAAGNEGNAGHHYSNTITNQDYQDVELKIGEHQKDLSLELWGLAPATFAVALISPSGEMQEKIPAKENINVQFTFVLEPTIISLAYAISDMSTGNELIFMQFKNLVPGIWRIRVYKESDIGESYHIWIPISNYVQPDTYFLQPDPYITLVETATAIAPICLGAYDHRGNSIYIASSRGYTINNTIKPDITAPGVNIFGPVSNTTFGELSGTSLSAAAGAAVAALTLQWAIVDGKRESLNTAEIKSLYIKGAQRPSREYPNREWGYGILNAYEVFESIRRTV